MLYSKQHEFVLIKLFIYIIKVLNEATGRLYIFIHVCVILIEMSHGTLYLFIYGDIT